PCRPPWLLQLRPQLHPVPALRRLIRTPRTMMRRPLFRETNVIERRDAPATVFVDADNTLWDTDGVFAAAQLGLLAQVEATTHTTLNVAGRLAYVRAIDQEIAERHHAGLRYPLKLLISATA